VNAEAAVIVRIAQEGRVDRLHPIGLCMPSAIPLPSDVSSG
jgi:hypothetical protein